MLLDTQAKTAHNPDLKKGLLITIDAWIENGSKMQKEEEKPSVRKPERK